MDLGFAALLRFGAFADLCEWMIRNDTDSDTSSHNGSYKTNCMSTCISVRVSKRRALKLSDLGIWAAPATA